VAGKTTLIDFLPSSWTVGRQGSLASEQASRENLTGGQQ
jgi:hypothetical protein